jgi:hypothetical protein
MATGTKYLPNICLSRHMLDLESENIELHIPAAKFVDNVLLEVLVICSWIENVRGFDDQ